MKDDMIRLMTKGSSSAPSMPQPGRPNSGEKPSESPLSDAIKKRIWKLDDADCHPPQIPERKVEEKKTG